MSDIILAVKTATSFAISKLHSRKFLVWAVATAGLFSHFVTNDQWLMISMMFLGVQGALDYKTNAVQSTLTGSTE